MDPLLLATALILILCFLGLSWFAGSDAPYVPSNMDKITEVLKASGLKKGNHFYELGSGDGRVVFEAAKIGAQSYGIEQSWIRVWYSRYKAKQMNLPSAYFYHGDIFQREYFPSDVLYAYLLQPAIDKLEKKLKKELKKDAVVITQRYHFKNLKPFKKIADFNLYRMS